MRQLTARNRRIHVDGDGSLGHVLRRLARLFLFAGRSTAGRQAMDSLITHAYLLSVAVGKHECIAWRRMRCVIQKFVNASWAIWCHAMYGRVPVEQLLPTICRVWCGGYSCCFDLS